MNKLFYRAVITVVFIAVFLSPSGIFAASLNLFADGDTFHVGDQFGANIKIDSEGSGVNAAQGTLLFPKDIVTVLSVDKTGSVFNFWLQEPTFSTTSGQIFFVGGATAGFSGKSLQIVKVTFKAKSIGEGDLTFTDAAVTAADGSGTNILTSVKGGHVTVIGPTSSPTATPKAPTPTPKPPVPSQKLPAKPVIEVPLYPDPSKWYNFSLDFLAKWKLPSDVSGVAAALDKNPVFAPSIPQGLFDSKNFDALEDGIWYVHARFINNVGWGPAAHYRIAIDTVPPLPFEVTILEGPTTQSPTPTINYHTTDELSGLDYYTIRIDGGDPISTGKTTYKLPCLKPGRHLVKVGAYDKAQNVTEKLVEIDISPIDPPKITSVTREVFTGEAEQTINITGTAESNASAVILILKKQTGQSVYFTNAIPDDSGNWRAFVEQKLDEGRYYFEATARDERCAQSLPVKSSSIDVQGRPFLTLLGFGLSLFWFLFWLFLLLLAVFWLALLICLFLCRRKKREDEEEERRRATKHPHA